MVLKTFNVNQDIFERFSLFCKGNGINMSRQIEMFMEYLVEDEPKVKESYLKKIEKLRKGKFIKVNNFAERYGL